MTELIVREYLGNGIEFKKVEGKLYANATSMCKAFNKRFNDWSILKSTSEMIEEVSEATRITVADLTIVENGNGSWIHEELVLELATWLNVKFRRWCQTQLTTLIREGEVSIKPKSEEQIVASLLYGIYQGGQSAIVSAKQLTEIEVAKATAPLKLEIEDKVKTIDNLTSDLDGTILRVIVTDYVNKVARTTGKHHSNIYTELYTIVGRALKIGVKAQHEKFCRNEEKLVEVNKDHNRENGLKGLDRVKPFQLKDCKHKVSIVEYICDILGEGKVLIDTMAKLFDVGVDEIISKYNHKKELGDY